MFPESFRFFPHPSPPGSALIRKRTVGNRQREQKLSFRGKAARRGAEPAAGWASSTRREVCDPEPARQCLRFRSCDAKSARSPEKGSGAMLHQGSIARLFGAFSLVRLPHGNKDRPRTHAAALKTGSSPPAACCTAHPRRCRVHRIPRRSWRCSYRRTNRN